LKGGYGLVLRVLRDEDRTEVVVGGGFFGAAADGLLVGGFSPVILSAGEVEIAGFERTGIDVGRKFYRRREAGLGKIFFFFARLAVGRVLDES
jgi:hypothetical protein